MSNKVTVRTDIATESGNGPDFRRWLALPVVLAAMFMAQFDLYVVNVAAPSLREDLGAGPAALELIVGGYAFAYAAGLITGGRLGDLLGHRRVFVIGTLAFTLASLLCGLAQNPTHLVIARLLQGLTGAIMVPQVLALITATFQPKERPRALAWFGVTMGVGAVAGQVLGGALLQANVFDLSWRIIFLVNIPIGLVCAALAMRLLPARADSPRPKLDPIGMVAISGGVALALIPLVIGRTEGWPAWSWICLAASVPVVVLALNWERRLAARGGQPLLNVDLFKDSAFNKGLIVNIGAFASFHSWMFTVTLVLQAGIGLTPLEAGLTFTPLGIAFAVASISARSLIGRWGSRVITLGTSIAAVGLAALVVALLVAGGDTGVATVIVPMMLVGLGNGLAVPALIGAVLAGIQPKNAGAAAGVLTTAQQFASAVGIAINGGLFFETLNAQQGTAAYARSLTFSTTLSLVIAVAAALVSLTLPRPKKAPAAEPAATPVAETTKS